MFNASRITYNDHNTRFTVNYHADFEDKFFDTQLQQNSEKPKLKFVEASDFA